MTTQEDAQDPQEDPMVGICTMCKGPIHEVRLKVAPHVLTCSGLVCQGARPVAETTGGKESSGEEEGR